METFTLVCSVPSINYFSRRTVSVQDAAEAINRAAAWAARYGAGAKVSIVRQDGTRVEIQPKRG